MNINQFTKQLKAQSHARVKSEMVEEIVKYQIAIKILANFRHIISTILMF